MSSQSNGPPPKAEKAANEEAPAPSGYTINVRPFPDLCVTREMASMLADVILFSDTTDRARYTNFFFVVLLPCPAPAKKTYDKNMRRKLSHRKQQAKYDRALAPVVDAIFERYQRSKLYMYSKEGSRCLLVYCKMAYKRRAGGPSFARKHITHLKERGISSTSLYPSTPSQLEIDRSLAKTGMHEVYREIRL
jgi:hypothetical protein